MKPLTSLKDPMVAATVTTHSILSNVGAAST
jgi:hypothetical protein